MVGNSEGKEWGFAMIGLRLCKGLTIFVLGRLVLETSVFQGVRYSPVVV